MQKQKALGGHDMVSPRAAFCCRSGRGPWRRITERSQEMFLEYAHYLPERATLKIVQRMQQLASTELQQVDLRTPMDADQVLRHISSIHSCKYSLPLVSGRGP